MLVWQKGKSFLFKILGDTTKRKLGWLGEEMIMVESCASAYGENQTKGRKLQEAVSRMNSFVWATALTEKGLGLVTSLNGNATLRTALAIRKALTDLQWKTLRHHSYSIVPSDYHHSFRCRHNQEGQHFRTEAEVRKWIDEWITLKDKVFLRDKHQLLAKWEKVTGSDDYHFD